MADRRLEDAPELSASPMRGSFLLLAGLALFPPPGAAQALPPDPQRAFEARSCEDAQARHAEAEAGSPLISPAENAAVLAQAVAQMRRLCGQKAPDETPENP